MSGIYWIILVTILTVLTGRYANKIISENGTSKWLYHEKSRQLFSIGNRNPAALFGYSIAYQENIHSLIVGSPNESEIGKIYKCAIEDKSTKCNAFESPALQHPHNLWLGANVNAGKSFLMACAPRTVKVNSGFTGMYGSCYYQNDWRQNSLKSMISIRPDDEARKRYYETVYHGVNQTQTPEILSDTLGWSSYVTGDGEIFVGGPAMSVGRTVVYSRVTQEPRFIKVDNQKLNHQRVNFNFGYSITAGSFEVEGEQMIAISSPYGTIGYGGVYFYVYSGSDSEYVLKDTKEMFVEGSQVGSLFGAALCAFDSGDGFSALLVGAPAYTPSSSKSHDIGVVYVYHFGVDYDDESTSFQPNPVRKVIGHSSGGYFGAAIVSVGDFDGDSIDEIAIGAPYEQNGRGAVYIYSGEQLLTLEDLDAELGTKLYLQKILPEDGPNQYFGWALSAPADADDNGCKELAIGAPGGNYVTLLRCMASVSVSFDVKFPDLKDQIKALSDGDAFFSFGPCLKVTYPDKPKPETLDTVIVFEVKLVHQNVKMFGANSNGLQEFKVPLRDSKSLICKTIQVQLPKDADYDEDITFNVTARLDRSQDPLQSSTFNPRLVLLNGTTSLTTSYTAPPLPGSDLSFEMRLSDDMKDGYIIGSTVNETLSFSLRNAASTAHGVCVRAQVTGARISALPPRICSYSADKLNCKKHTLKKAEIWNVTVTLDTRRMTSANEKLEIYAELWTKNCSKPTGKNLTRIFNLITDNNLNITGYATEVRMTQEELQLTRGKSFEHIYTIINFGRTTWTDLRCEVSLTPGIHKSAVYVIHDDSTSKHCVINGSNHTATCKIEEVKQNSEVQIRVQMDIGPDDPITAQILKGKITSAVSHLTVTLKKGDIRNKKLSSKITITEAAGAPIWIYIVAGLVGLLIVVIICWALHECGFLRRDKKKQLEELKENVKRQSMRRSVMLRQSTIEVLKNQGDPSEQQRLVELPEEEMDSADDLATRDPARAAFEVELARALSKDNNRVVAPH